MSRVLTKLACIAIGATLALPAMAQTELGPPLPTPSAPAVQVVSPQQAGIADLVSAAQQQQLDAAGINPLAVMDSAGAALPGARSGESGLSTALNIMIVLTVVSLAPSIMLMCTCFVRILIVLGLLRQAIGAQSVPPPQVITALALFMTLLVMTPTLDRINDEAIAPYRAGEITNYEELWARGKQPVRDFMFAQIEATGNWSSLYMMLEYRGVDVSQPEKLTRSDVDMVSLVPAYMLSELKTAFMMGFRIYLPFLVIDMVISTMLIAMGMMMLPPVLISLPFKLLLFVLVDGWTLIVGGLLTSFAQPALGEQALLLVPTADNLLQHSPQVMHALACVKQCVMTGGAHG